jgi:iron complex outermembrane recepter protein
MISRLKLTMSALMALCSFSVTAVAQQAASPPAEHGIGNILEEVVVSSARKRSESVQTTPIAVTALDETLLERAHVTDLTDISALAPNLHMARTLSTADAVTIYMRGFGVRSNDPSVDPHVATFLDGIYQPLVSGTLIDMFDVAQVEILGGPQGTLFGKNAPIGAVSITTQKPTGKLGAEFEADLGRFDHRGIRAKINFPIIQDILAAKVSFVSKTGGNWIKDLATGDRNYGGESVKAGRLALRFTPGPNFEWDVVSSLLSMENPPNALRNTVVQSGTFAPNPTQVSQGLFSGPDVATYCFLIYGGACPTFPYGATGIGFRERPHGQTIEIASNISYHFSPVTVTAVAGHIKYYLHENTDVDGTAPAVLDAFNDETRSKQDSIELRVSSNKGGGADFGGAFDWVLGAFYSNNDFSFDNNLKVLGNFIPGGLPAYQKEYGNTKSSAVFAHGIYHFTDQWSASAGVRSSKDKKNHQYQFVRDEAVTSVDPSQRYEDTPASFSDSSFEAGVQWQFDPQRMVYFRFAQGYQAGGFLGFPGGPRQGVAYKPTKNDAFEVGLKSDWFSKRLRVNLDYFHNKLKDLQVQGVIPSPNPPGFLQSVTNAGASKVQGVELELTAVPIDSFTAHVNMGYLDAKYSTYVTSVCNDDPLKVTNECKGIPFTFAPKFNANVGADYTMHVGSWGTATLGADVNYQSEQFLSDPPFPSSRQGGYGIVNSTLGFNEGSGKYGVEFYVTNLLDKKYMSEFSDSGGLTISQLDGRPQEWGIRLKANFGN